MFKGKISFTTNNHGKVETVEREFDNQEEYDAFLQENSMHLGPTWDLGSYLDDWFLGHFLGSGFSDHHPEHLPEGVDLQKHAEEVRQAKEKEEKNSKILRGLRKSLGRAQLLRKEMVSMKLDTEEIDTKIKKIEEEISKKELGK